MANNKEKGNTGERLAAKALVQKGYHILDKNYRGYHGEIDLIAGYGNLIVFVEVKLRTSIEKGMPKEAVTREKQKRIIQTAREYIVKKRLQNKDFRFDVIEILYQKEQAFYHHIENAFWLGEG